ncbi:MAG TPA: hypothetical protein VGG64_26715 [Pirellulales bacterium]
MGTVIALWLAWELSYVRQRRAAIDEVAGLGGGVWLAEDVADYVAFPPSIPIWRRLMGDISVAQLILPIDYLGRTENNERVTALFPETIRPERPPFEVMGKLSAEEVREIWRVVKDYCKKNNISEEMLGIEEAKNGDVEVELGEVRGPLDGGGTYLILQRKKGAWVVVNQGRWVSRAVERTYSR